MLHPDLRALRQHTVGGQLPRAHAWLAERRTDIRDVVVIGMSLDDPTITPSENCRYDLGVAFPQQTGGILWRNYSLAGTEVGPSRIVACPIRMRCAGI